MCRLPDFPFFESARPFIRIIILKSQWVGRVSHSCGECCNYLALFAVFSCILSLSEVLVLAPFLIFLIQ